MTPRDLAPTLKRGTVAPVYLVIGDDDAGKDEVVASLTSLVEEDLRGFNVERFTAGDARPDDVVFAVRTLPMLGERRVVVFAHIERLFKGRKKLAEVEDEDGAEDVGGRRTLAGSKATSPIPSPRTCWCSSRPTSIAARSSASRSHKLAVTVECDGFNTDGFNGAQTALRDAMQFAAERVEDRRQAHRRAGTDGARRTRRPGHHAPAQGHRYAGAVCGGCACDHRAGRAAGGRRGAAVRRLGGDQCDRRRRCGGGTASRAVDDRERVLAVPDARSARVVGAHQDDAGRPGARRRGRAGAVPAPMRRASSDAIRRWCWNDWWWNCAGLRDACGRPVRNGQAAVYAATRPLRRLAIRDL